MANSGSPGMTLDMHALMADLARGRSVFHSEADFQHALAWELHRQFPDASVRLEKPLPVNGSVAHVDILVQLGPATLAVELKYKTRRLAVEAAGEPYSLRNHSAQDLGRYDFAKDIGRLEDIIAAYPDARGYAVFLTNEAAYWSKATAADTVDAAFRMHEGRVLSGELAWGSRASAGTMRTREKPIRLRSSYKLEWRTFSTLAAGSGSTFRYLAVPVVRGD